jgi:hypothetical protein
MLKQQVDASSVSTNSMPGRRIRYKNETAPPSTRSNVLLIRRDKHRTRIIEHGYCYAFINNKQGQSRRLDRLNRLRKKSLGRTARVEPAFRLASKLFISRPEPVLTGGAVPYISTFSAASEAERPAPGRAASVLRREVIKIDFQLFLGESVKVNPAFQR